jgi:putative copper resistance protein D
MSAGQIPTLLWRDWSANWPLDVFAALVVLAYAWRATRVRRGWPPSRTLAFAAGVGCVVIAIQSGVGAFDDRLLSDHMVQHLLLLELAPLLLLMGRPSTLLLRSAAPARRPALARAVRSLRPLTRPIWCLAVFWVVVLGTHLPWFYDRAVAQPLLHESEHLLYLAAGLVMWWPLHDEDPLPSHRLDGFARLAYVVVAMLPMAVIGAYLNRDPTLLYPVYAQPAHALGISAVADQQQAGAIMWVVGTSLMVASGLWQAMAALDDEERRLRSRERLIDARSDDLAGER